MLQALAEHASLALTDARMIEAMRTAEKEKDAMLADLLDRDRRAGAAGGSAAARPEDGGGGPACRRHRPRLQQPAHGHPRLFELVAESLGEDDPRVDSVHEISGAAERAAALTQQLLAFSRKEVVQPQTIDLNQAVPDLLKLLRRMLRESIEFELDLAPGLWSTNIDRSQLEQVIVNLAVNAGDAMAAEARFGSRPRTAR